MSDGGVANALRSVMIALDGAAIGYMVVGSFASATHGEPRTTRNLDLVIDPTARQLDQFLAAIDVAQFYVDADVARDALQRRSMFNLIEMTSGWKIDLIIRKERRFRSRSLPVDHRCVLSRSRYRPHPPRTRSFRSSSGQSSELPNVS